MKYQGKFRPKRPEKYLGNPTQIFYRSGWELSVMFWCDNQQSILAWGSEEIKIPYVCPADNLRHRYFVDFIIKFKTGKTVLVEVKPKRYLFPPKLKTKKPGKKFMTELYTYEKNKAKWEAATSYSKMKDWVFEIWTEDTLQQLGIKSIKGL